ncbi:MAG: hypothetical protein JXM69_01675 [Anaerolineae bacterium]|nr:hypothetical protein [Anaerolineae bacterium]
MWAIFGLGIVVGIVVVVGLLRLTMATEPAGCVITFGFVFCLLLLLRLFYGSLEDTMSGISEILVLLLVLAILLGLIGVSWLAVWIVNGGDRLP